MKPRRGKTGIRKGILLTLLALIAVAAVVIGINAMLDAKAAEDFSEMEDNLKAENVILKYPVFDGNRVWENAAVVIENGVISADTVLGEGDVDSRYFLMPGLVDAHTHVSSEADVVQMIRNGVTATCDVSASDELLAYSDLPTIWSARSGAFVFTEDGKAFVEDMVCRGAKYIKVVIDLPEIMMGGGLMEKQVIEDIVATAHEHDLKVAVHAISIAGVRLAVDAGADLLIHIPIGEELTEELAQQIADKGIEVMPTLVMMKAFADSPLYGFEPEDYQDAVNAVQLLHSLNVPILAATDANPGGFVPKVEHGIDLHREMQLLVEAGLTPLEVLQSATGNVAEAFGIENMGSIAPGQPATMILVEGRPDQEITDSTKIVQIWINGKPILKWEE